MLTDNDRATLSKVRKNNEKNCEKNLRKKLTNKPGFRPVSWQQLYAKCWENVPNIEKICQSVLKVWESLLKAENVCEC